MTCGAAQSSCQARQSSSASPSSTVFSKAALCLLRQAYREAGRCCRKSATEARSEWRLEMLLRLAMPEMPA